MDQRITGREIIAFIAKFRLWDAYLEGDEAGTIPGGGIGLRAPGWGCDECEFTLYANGEYEVHAWVSESDEEGDWRLVTNGDIFKEVEE